MPTVMICEGTHSGSRGPVYYPEVELKKSAPYWNGKPVVIYHPDMDTSSGYAGNPAIFNKQKVGTLFNTRFSNKKLIADAWIDVERVKTLDERVFNSIQSKKIMEVSTGLMFTDTVDGCDLFLTAINIIPDHLAILPDKVGACSVAAGAGLCRNRINKQALQILKKTIDSRRSAGRGSFSRSHH